MVAVDAWHESWAEALIADDPVGALRAVVVDLLKAGAERDGVRDELHRYAIALADEGRESEYEASLDVLDLLVGWCGPHARID